MEDVVTPSHLMYGHTLSKPSYDKPNNFNVESLTWWMKYLPTLAQHYWNHWKIECLLENWTLWIPQMWKEVDTRINGGDIVLVEDTVLKWNYWELGKTARLIKRHDERVRATTVKICNNSIHQLINCPICKLYPLQIRANENIKKDEVITDQTILDIDVTFSYELNCVAVIV